ncbi:Light-harvesting complex-like protein ohp2, chloroplastic [Ancistrocladus abbreviatus]
MSMATSSIPCIPLPTSSSSTSTSSCTSTSCSSFKYTNKPRCLSFTTIRSSQTDQGPLRRPVAPPPPPLREPSPPPPPSSLKPPAPPPAPPSSPPPPQQVSPAPVEETSVVVTLEYQRQKAKELQEYFKQKKLEEADQGPFFGFLGKNEITNGRWAMFGFAVGMLTEYATGSDFVDQVKILLSNFGIVDLE